MRTPFFGPSGSSGKGLRWRKLLLVALPLAGVATLVVLVGSAYFRGIELERRALKELEESRRAAERDAGRPGRCDRLVDAGAAREVELQFPGAFYPGCECDSRGCCRCY
jgi:hypothetical protein